MGPFLAPSISGQCFFAPAVVASKWAFILDLRTSSLLSLFDWESLVRNRFFSSEIDSTAPFEVLANPPPFPHTHTPLRSHSGVDEVVKRVHLNKIEKSRIPSNPLGTHRLHLAPPDKKQGPKQALAKPTPNPHTTTHPTRWLLDPRSLLTLA